VDGLRRGEPNFQPLDVHRNSSWRMPTSPPFASTIHLTARSTSTSTTLLRGHPWRYATPAIDLTNSPQQRDHPCYQRQLARRVISLFLKSALATNYQGLQVVWGPLLLSRRKQRHGVYNNASFTDPVELEHAPAERFARRLSDGHSRSAGRVAL